VIVNKLHGFDLTPAEAIQLQQELAPSVIQKDDRKEVRLIAGVDVSLGRQGGQGRAAVVVFRYPSLETVAESIFEDRVSMPYVPGLLSFRELPLILPALEKLRVEPDLFIVDGQGVAHPRRLGIAAHLGLFTGKPTIGCAKSRLCGDHSEVGDSRGDFVDLHDRREVIGRVVRTKENCKPLYISVGNSLSLETAVDWVIKLTGCYRLPEPVRQAHLAASRNTVFRDCT
jgi:deoxyribonuclease V